MKGILSDLNFYNFNDLQSYGTIIKLPLPLQMYELSAVPVSHKVITLLQK
jgi:hypothetical protein